jgi:arginine kinase
MMGSHLASPDDIGDECPTFPPGTNSLLAQFLSPAIWHELGNSSDAHGFSFKQAIFSGCKNTDSTIGVYAGSHDSYRAFAPLFDPIIEAYHGHKPGDKHRAHMDYSQLHCPPLPKDEDRMILSTRIRVARNLAEFPLGPALSRVQRDDIERRVITATGNFTGDLNGKYYSLATMTSEEQEQLITDHFLFKEGDRFLEACNLNRDWPRGRGIFHNENKTFLTWVNEEDQLRIISMQAGSDIATVFRRLCDAAAGFEKQASFSHDEHLGYITSCPSNLGTGLRASVHICLPQLGQRMDEFSEIAAQYQVQIRGIHGEHSASPDHVYDISNRRRLGRGEVELVQDMYDGVKAMITREKELS